VAGFGGCSAAAAYSPTTINKRTTELQPYPTYTTTTTTTMDSFDAEPHHRRRASRTRHPPAGFEPDGPTDGSANHSRRPAPSRASLRHPPTRSAPTRSSSAARRPSKNKRKATPEPELSDSDDDDDSFLDTTAERVKKTKATAKAAAKAKASATKKAKAAAAAAAATAAAAAMATMAAENDDAQNEDSDGTEMMDDANEINVSLSRCSSPCV
jgi:hypothetical protein